jgi:hypothetical protein
MGARHAAGDAEIIETDRSSRIDLEVSFFSGQETDARDLEAEFFLLDRPNGGDVAGVAAPNPPRRGR